MPNRKALITGIAGQDGSYLAELLLSNGYEVHGVARPNSLEDPERRLARILPILDRITLHETQIDSYAGIQSVVDAVEPAECYHLAAQSFVNYSLDDGSSTLDTNIKGTLHLLSAIRRIAPKCRFYFAGTSEMFGSADESPQRESTRFHPRSIYGISKLAGYELVRNYRESHGLFAASGLLYNHESPRRGNEYVTRKITRATALAAAGKLTRLHLGNLAARRDWGHAREYVWAMWRMLQMETPTDYVIATGVTHSVEEFAALAFRCAGLDWRDFVEMDPRFYRPSEALDLAGDSSKAARELGWKPRIQFEQLVDEMVAADRAAIA
ncbi:MAG TPA: GDP-mannose 4,6-dehydratase [Bryobacteraceae bacterium]|jgi:GDPmannose 4,6-dehydratase